jgi:dTMP kinase
MTDERRGHFITFEGGEGSGKTTQMRILAERLRTLGREVIETVEPGGTAIGNQIRRILLDRANIQLCAMPEMLLYFAARAQNLEELILPALDRRAIVLADRYTDSTLAYQGAGRGLGQEMVLEMHRVACRGIWPEITLYIDIEPELGLARRHATDEVNRIDVETLDFHRRVRETYLGLAQAFPDRIKVIDGSGNIEQVAAAIGSFLDGVL